MNLPLGKIKCLGNPSIHIHSTEVTVERMNIERQLHLSKSYEDKQTRQLIESIIGVGCAANKYRRDTKDQRLTSGIGEIKNLILIESLGISVNFNLSRGIKNIRNDLKEALENSSLNYGRLSIITLLSRETIVKLSKNSNVEKCIKSLIMYNEIGFNKLIKPFSSFWIDNRSQECDSIYQEQNHSKYEQKKENEKYEKCKVKKSLIDRIHEKGNM